MPANTVQVAPDLKLDADYIAGASIALLGKRGAGKSFGSRVLAEELFEAHVQTVIIDPMGVFWGLRSSTDGEHEGLPIPVFGGDHGDAPLESTAGHLMADLVVEEGLSMVLDLSGFGSRTQERTFAAAFLDRLYRTNKDLVHLIVDEADLLAPQKPRREDTRLLATMENIVRRGRNKGIGITMATQRAAVLNKDVLTQVDALVALRVSAPQDRDAIRDWVRGQGEEDIWSQIAPSLPGLANGESWWWIPEKDILKKTQIRYTRTFDSSPTRKRGHSTRAPKTFADVDLAAITARIAATIERAKSTDPRELTRRVRELERELAARPTPAPQDTQVREVIVEKPVLDEVLVARLEEVARALTEAMDSTQAATNELLTHIQQTVQDTSSHAALVSAAVETITSAVTTAGTQAATATPHPSPTPRPRTTHTQPAPTPPPAPAAAGDNGDISPARRRLLDALASLETIGVTQARKTQLALWAGVSPKSSGYANNLGALRTAGLIDYPAPSHVSLTTDGRSHATAGEHIANDNDLHRKVEQLLPPARWRILAPLIEAYPQALTKSDLAEAAGVSPASSGYANNLGALRSLGLLDYPTPGQVAATDVLFLNT